MPDFDKLLNPIIKERTPSLLEINLLEAKKYPALQISNTPMGLLAGGTKEDDSTLESLAGEYANSVPTRFRGNAVGLDVLAANQRYKGYNPFINNEEAAAQGQHWWEQAINGVGKGLAITGTTFLQNTVGMANGIAEWSKTGEFSSFYNNDFNKTLDKLNRDLEDKLPNYYTEKQKNAHWYSPDKIFTANFFWDGIVKNMGFAAGTYLSAGVFSAGLKGAASILSNIPKLGKLMSVGQSATALQASETLGLAAAQSGELGISLAGASRQFVGNFNILNKAQRGIVSALSTTGEAGFEAYHNMNEYRDKRIEEYTKKYGYAPTGADLNKINEDSKKVGNISFAANVVALTISNYIQLPKIGNSTFTQERALMTEFQRETNKIVNTSGKWGIKQARTTVGKTLDFLHNKVRPLTFSTMEAIEEGSQYAISVGTQDYIDKKSKGVDNSVLQSILHGIKGTITTDEGMENVLIGGLSGSLMTLRSNIKKQIQTDRNTKELVDALNNENYQFSNFTKDTVDSIVRGTALQEEREALLQQGDKLGSKSKEADYIINYLLPRIKFGRMDLVNSDIEDTMALAATDEGFEQLKKEGKVQEGDTKDAYLNRLSNFKSTAEQMQNLYESLSLRYGTQTDDKGRRVYTDSVLEKMIYSSMKIDDYGKRIDSLATTLPPLDVPSIIEDVIKGNDDLYNQAVTEIESSDLVPEKKTSALEALEDIAKMSLFRDMHIKEYLEFRDSPTKHQEETKVTPTDGAGNVINPTGEFLNKETITIKTARGEKEYATNVEYFAGEVIIGKDKNGIEIPGVHRFTILGQNEDGTIKIKDNNGERDITPDHFESLKIGTVASTLKNKKARFYLDNLGTVLYYNFGAKKGGKVPGRLVYSDKEGILLFQYTNKKGEVKTIEVTGDMYDPKKGYKEAKITFGEKLTPVQQKSLEEYQAEEEERKTGKIKERRKIIADMIKNATLKKEAAQKLIEQKTAALEKLKAELEIAFTASESKTPKGNLTKAAKLAKKTVDTLTTAVSQLENELIKLEDELVEVDTTVAFAESLKDNLQELGTTDADFLEDLSNEIEDLKDLRSSVEEQMSLTESLIAEIKKVLDKAKDTLKTFIDKLFKKYPEVPVINVFDENLIYDRDQVDDLLNEFAVYPEEAPKREDIEQLAQGKWANKLIEYLGSLTTKLDEINKEIIAKGIILDKFKSAIAIAEREAKEFEQAVKSGKLATEIKSTMSNSVNTTTAYTDFEQDSKKSDMDVVMGTITPTGKGDKQVGTYVDRSQKFGAILNDLIAKNKKIKGRKVTFKTQDKVLPGLMQHLFPSGTQSDWDNMIVLVMTNSQGKLIDETGKVIPKDSADILDKAIYQVFPLPNLEQEYTHGKESMFRQDSDPKEVARLKDLYAKRRQEILKSDKLQPLEDVSASFGLFEYVTKKDENGEVVINKYGNPSIDFSARTSVAAAGLVSDSALKNDNLITIATKAGRLFLGKASYIARLGSVFLSVPGGGVKLNNRKLNQEEAETIADVIEEISKRAFKEKTVKNPETQQMFEWLKSVIYWGIARDKQTRKQKNPGKSNVWFETDKDTKEMFIYFGSRDNIYHFTPTSIAQNKPSIIAHLLEMYGNTNTPKTYKSAGTTYRQITGIAEDGTPIIQKWQNYQTFLLSDKYPDGTNRPGEKIPLTTTIRPLEGPEDNNRKGIYFIAEGDMGLYEPKEKQVEEDPEDEEDAEELEEKAGFVLDNTTVNEVKINDIFGSFKFKMDKAALFSILDKFGADSISPTSTKIAEAVAGLMALKGFTVNITQDQINIFKTIPNFASASDKDIKEVAASLVLAKLSTELVSMYVDSKTRPPGTKPKQKLPFIEIKDRDELFEKAIEVVVDVKRASATLLKNKLNIDYNRAKRLIDQLEAAGVLEAFTGAKTRKVLISSKEQASAFFEKPEPPASEKPLFDLSGKKNVFTLPNIGEFNFSFNVDNTIKALESDPTLLDNDSKKIDYIIKLLKNKELVISLTKEVQDKVAGILNTTSTEEVIAALGKIVFDASLSQIQTTSVAETPVEELSEEDEEIDNDWDNSFKNHNFEDDDFSDVPFRLSREVQGQFDTENWDRVEQRLRLMLPNVPLYRVKNLIQATNGMQAFGMFRDAAIYVYQNAEAGTAYHEVFEAVWKMFVDIDEKNAILKEFRSRPGYFEEHHTGRKIKFSEATDAELKEEIAEEFRRTILEKDKATPKTLIGRLFKDIIDFITNFITGKNALINTRILFDNIGRGYYANQIIPGEQQLALAKMGIIDIEDAYGDSSSNFRLDGISAVQLHELMQQMTYSTYVYLNKTSKDLLSTNTIVSSKELYDSLYKELFVERKDAKGKKIPGIIKAMDIAIKKSIVEGVISEELGTKRSNDLRVFNRQAIKQWSRIVEEHQKSMAVYKIDFDESADSINQNEEKSKGEDSHDSNKIDAYKKVSAAVKLMFSTIPDTEVVNNKTVVKMSSIGGVTFVESPRVFITLMNLLHTSTNITQMLERLSQLAENNTTYKALYRRITGTLPTPGEVILNSSILSRNDFKLLTGMWNAFKKSNPEVLTVFIQENGEVSVGNTNLTSIARQSRYTMTQNIIASIKKGNKYFSKNKITGKISAKESLISLRTSPNFGKKFTDYTNFLKVFGIDLGTVPLKEQAKISSAVKGLIESLASMKDVVEVSSKIVNSNNQLLKIAEVDALIKSIPKDGSIKGTMFESTFYGINGDKLQTFIGVNLPSNVHDLLSSVENISDLENTGISYLLTDVFSNNGIDSDGYVLENSVILNRIFDSETGDKKPNTENILKPAYIDGTIDMLEDKRIPSDKLNSAQRLAQNISLILEGIYPNLVPGDAQLEHYLRLHSKEEPFVTIDDISQGDYQNIFRSYFISEVKLSTDNRIVASKRKNSDLRFFKDIFASDAGLHSAIVEAAKTEDPIDIYESEEFNFRIRNAISQFVESETEDTKITLEKFDLITKIKEGYKTTLPFANNEMTDSAMELELKKLTVNYIISTIELHKLLYADPYLYNDELKRIKNFTSPKVALADSPEINKVLNDIYNRDFKPEDLGYYDFTKSYFKTVVISDVNSVLDQPGYSEVDDSWKETDGGGYITLKAYRAFKLKSSLWSENDELQYKHDIRYEEIVKKIITAKTEESRDSLKKELEAHEKNNPKVKTTYTPIKPIVAGSKDNGRSYNDLMLDKYALIPISFRIFHKLNPESNMIKLYNKMSDENVDYVVFESGRKVGVEKIYPLYIDGKFNDAPFETPEDIAAREIDPELPTMSVNVPFSVLSLQSEVPSKDIAKTAQGTQLTKLATMDFMDAGVPIDFQPEVQESPRFINWISLTEEEKRQKSELYNMIQHNKDLLEAKIENGYNNLLNLLGITETEEGFIIKDKEAMIKTLETEMFKQEINVNIIKAFEDLRNDVVLIEATPAYQQIRNILYSIANNNVVRTKISGGMKVQAPSTLLESGDRVVQHTSKNGTKFYTSEILKFYTKGEVKEDGKIAKTNETEIMIGRWFKSPLTDEEILDSWYEKDADGNRGTTLTSEGRKALTGIGFRIPTQKQNSVEAFIIKGFLPEEYGDSVIVPSGIVKKAGSDFDIDKLSMYFKNLFTDPQGNLRVIPFYGIGDKAKQEFKDRFISKISSELNIKLGLLQGTKNLKDTFVNIMKGDANDYTIKKWLPILKELFEEKIGDEYSIEDIDKLFTDMQTTLNKSIEELSDKDAIDYLADKYASKMYTKSLENEYITSLQNLVTHPSNFDNLIKPNSAENMKDLAEEINTLKGTPDIDYLSPGFMLSLVKMDNLRASFIGGKRGIGIAATAQTNNALNQASAIIINPENLTTVVPEDDRVILGNGKLAFPEYNSIMYKGEKVATLSKKLNAAGEYISDIIGMFIDGYVDISRGPWIMQLGAKPDVAGTWLFLIKAGVPIKSVAYFMNQPIIEEYLTSLENQGTTWLYNTWAISDHKKQYKGKFAGTITEIPSESDLRNMVGNKNLNDEQLAQQVFIFDEFLKYSKMAEHLLNVQSGTNLDTATLNDPFLYLKKEEDFKKAQKSIFSNIEMDKDTKELKTIPASQAILNNSFIGVLKKFLFNIRKAYSTILISDQGSARRVLEQVLIPYTSKSDKDFIRISQKVVSDFFDWGVQTNGGFNKKLGSILLGTDTEASVAEQIMDFRNTIFGDPKKDIPADMMHPLYNNIILENIIMEVGPKEGSPNNLKILELGNKVYEQNLIINSFEEIKDYLKANNNLALYEKLVSLAILQSGLTSSPISFSKLLPYEDFKDVYYSTIDKLNNLSDLNDFVTNKVFERNNWNDSSIVPVVKREVRTNMTGQSTVPTESGISANLKKAYNDVKIPRVVILPQGHRDAAETIMYSWVENISKEEREKRALTGDTSHFKKILMRKVYVDKANNIPLLQISVSENNNKIYKHHVYVAINSWGDSFRAKEFYNQELIFDNDVAVSNMPMSIFNNGNLKVGYSYNGDGKKTSTGEVSDEVIYEILTGENVINSSYINKTSIQPQSQGFKNPDVILPIGTSGSGKSTFIKSLPQENLVVIEPDAMRVEFTGDINDKSKDKEIYEEAAKRAIAALQGKETSTQIYNKLGNKTKNNNIVINSVYQQTGVQYAESIGGVFSLRLKNTNNHFGNPFSSVESEIQEGLIKTNSTKESVERYIEWILSDDTIIKPEQHKFIREQLKSGTLKGKNIIYYKELGEPSHATALDYLINKYDWNNHNKKKQVVFDTTNLTKDKRLPFIEAIKKAIPTANIQYKLMELNPELAKQRIRADIAAGKNRANVPDSTIDRHAEAYKQMLEDIKNEPITPFSETVVSRGFTLSIDKKGKDQGKANLANRFIGYGVAGTSTYQYGQDAKKAGIPVNYEGTINESTIAFVSVNGNNKASENAIYETIENAREVLEKGGTIIMDSTFDANRSWNKNGEALVQEGIGIPTGQTSQGYNYWGKNPELNEQQYEKVTESTNKITKSKYTRESVQNDPNTAYVFTENKHSITAFPNRPGGGSAVIRGLDNAFGIVTKKKYDYITRENVDYADTAADFNDFVKTNTKLIADIKNSGMPVVFPAGFAVDKAYLPTRFAKWLQTALFDNFGLVTELNKSQTGLISKSVLGGNLSTNTSNQLSLFDQETTKSLNIKNVSVLKNGIVNIEGVMIPFKDVNSDSLEKLGYTPDQIGLILDKIC